MECVILSKTRMTGNSICVGAMLTNGSMLRLLKRNGFNQDNDTEYNIGDVWDVDIINKVGLKYPHVEDVLVQRSKYLNRRIEDLSQYIQNRPNVQIWNGSADNLFDGLLEWTNGGSGYISENGEVSQYSVGFWISNRDLKCNSFHGIRFEYPNQGYGWRSLKYVGVEENVPDSISEGTLLRVSLARWWTGSEGGQEERCYLQLSGWYESLGNLGTPPSRNDYIPPPTEEDIPNQ